MQIDSTSTAIQATETGATGSTSTGTSKKTDALGKDAFLNLLITQLQHQDPTAPMADGEFLAQLAQFTSLEQLQDMNKNLATIASFYTAMEGMSDSGSPSPNTTIEGKA
jgi:flagellar basal-body rod modification protein FlgD